MKIRSGFVSNSSSASLIIIWKDHHECYIKNSLNNLNITDPSIQNAIISKTIAKQEHGFYHSSFWTCMYNGDGFKQDFPTEASILLESLQKADEKRFCYTHLIMED